MDIAHGQYSGSLLDLERYSTAILEKKESGDMIQVKEDLKKKPRFSYACKTCGAIVKYSTMPGMLCKNCKIYQPNYAALSYPHIKLHYHITGAIYDTKA